MGNRIKYFNLTKERVLKDFDVEPAQGLSLTQVKARLKKYGPNRLKKAKGKNAFLVLLNQFKSLIVLLLTAAALVSFAFQELVEGVAIVVVILVNAAIGFVMEIRAVRSMEALRRLVRINTRVRREGDVKEIFAEVLVPGDIVVLEGGDLVPSDIRLIEASKLHADESSLTGESFPVSKQLNPIDEDAPLAERSNMVFMGTALTRGSCEGAVVATGLNTELGKISSLVEESKEETKVDITILNFQMSKSNTLCLNNI